MTDEPGNLVLELLQSIRADAAGMLGEMREQRGCLGAIEGAGARIESHVAGLRADAGGRFDRVLDRLERIERRLDLRDA